MSDNFQLIKRPLFFLNFELLLVATAVLSGRLFRSYVNDTVYETIPRDRHAKHGKKRRTDNQRTDKRSRDSRMFVFSLHKHIHFQETNYHQTKQQNFNDNRGLCVTILISFINIYTRASPSKSIGVCTKKIAQRHKFIRTHRLEDRGYYEVIRNLFGNTF